jgi:WD40 repeat protein
LKGNLLADLNKNTSPIVTAAFIDNGKQILTISKDGTVKRWYTPEAIMEWLKTSAIPQLTKEEKENLGIEEL